MPPRRAESGLTDEQLAGLAGDLAAGKRPRVRLSGSQFPDGMSGSVLRIGDPAIDGDDFVLVQVKVHGVIDELRFSPKELAVGRRRPAAAEATAPKAAPAKASPVRRAAPAKAAGKPAGRPRSSRATLPAAPAKAAKTAQPAQAAKPVKAATAPRRSSPPPTVTITITSSGSTWSVAARRGARAVVKKAEVTPGTVAAIAALLDDPNVEDAVAAVNDGARAVAEARAEQLRAELAAVEAVLVSHRRP